MNWFEYTGWALFAFGAVRAAVALVNLVTCPWLRRRATAGTPLPKVSVLIPARNEEANIGNLLGDLAGMADELHEVIVCDDQSDDATRDIVEGFAARCGKIRLLEGEPLPAGWLGKNRACHNLAAAATGGCLLFLDADVRISRGTVPKAAAYLTSKGLRLLSIFPTQLMPDFGTRLAVPLMNWILLGLLPLAAVRVSRFTSLCAANGQFMLFDAAAYRALEPHRMHRASAVEDMAIAREYKQRGLRSAVLLGRGDVSCTMYSGLRSAVSGFSKNIFHFFGGSRTLCILFALATTAAPFVVFAANGRAAGAACIALVVATRVSVSLASSQPPLWNLLLAIPQQITLWIIIITASAAKKRKNLEWKGRNIYSDI